MSVLLITQPLDTTNYYFRARFIWRALRIKNKVGFIDDILKMPIDPNNSLMDHWLQYNDNVISLIPNTLSLDIKSGTLNTETTYQL